MTEYKKTCLNIKIRLTFYLLYYNMYLELPSTLYLIFVERLLCLQGKAITIVLKINKFLMTLNIFPLIPALNNIVNSSLRQTMSKAFFKSRKQRNSRFF